MEKVIRTLSCLKSKKYIRIIGKKIIILDKEGLINQLSPYVFTNEESTDSKLFYPNLFY